MEKLLISKIKSRIYIHPLYYLVLIVMTFTGLLKYYFLYTLVILIHELGHIFASIILKWNINKITIYPFGCMTTFNNKLNSSIIEEFLILIMGPLFQIVFNMIYPTKYHMFILIFNLLPIYPLDGSKILFLLFNKLFSYYKSYIYIYFISYITIIVLIIYNFDFISLVILLNLLYDVYKYNKNINNTMLKFIYERYKDKNIYSKNNIIIGNKLYSIKRCKNNYFYINNKLISEYKIYRKLFNKYEFD